MKQLFFAGILLLALQHLSAFGATLLEQIDQNAQISKEIQAKIVDLRKIGKTNDVASIDQRKLFLKKLKTAIKPIKKQIKKLKRGQAAIAKKVDKLPQAFRDEINRDELFKEFNLATTYFEEGWLEMPPKDETDFLKMSTSAGKKFARSIEHFEKYRQTILKVKKVYLSNTSYQE